MRKQGASRPQPRQRAADITDTITGITAGPVAKGGSGAEVEGDRPGPGAVYRDPSAPVEQRVHDLLARMTLDEKVAQMIALWATKADIMEGLTFDPQRAGSAYPHGVGQVSRASDKRGGPGVSAASGGTAANWRTPQETVAFVNAVQRWAIEETRLGIPVLFHEESLHGYMATEATMFPQAIALAGSFDTDLMREVSAVIAREVRARGVPLVLSPVVDIARDPRWGRIEETFGEDPCLAAEMGVAAVEGLQGPGRPERLEPGKVFATLKHMTGHGQPEAGNNIAPAQLSERELRENFFPPFRAVVERTAIRAVMPSYNEIDGVPSHASRWLLEDVLRGEWGFDGVIVSDYNGIEELATLHGVAGDAGQAARAAVRAGVDCDLPDGQAYRTLAEQVRAGEVGEDRIDAAVARILELKFRAGLFESPFGDELLTAAITGNDEARALALTAARRSLCLLQNDGTLPLEPGRHRTVAVIGPNAAIARLGGYSSVPKQSVSLLEGIRHLLAGQAEVVTAQGVFITQSEDRAADTVLPGDPQRNRRLIGEAVATARGADAIVLAIGDTEQTSREAFAKHHLGDRTGLDLLAQQNELFDALHALGKPLVVCAINGRPPCWPNVAAHANAILECWYPGQEGGTAMAEALFGVVNPGAKLPVTVARDPGHLPFFYNHKPSARRGYLFADPAPLFPFGHGLSYTRFEIGEPRLSAARIAAGEGVEVAVDVCNTGTRSGDEVVQVYLRDEIASVTQPVRALRAFRRVTLEPGQCETLRFRLQPSAFRIWNDRMEEVIEPGRFTVMVGPNSVDLKSTTLDILECGV
jgi:beta-glucosidase